MIKPAPSYVPSHIWWKDLIKRVVGEPNLIKRLQLPDIFQALALLPNEVALDFGCGRGYMTYEMARRCRKAYGIDIADVERNLIPAKLKGKLEFIHSRGEQTPFESATFDVILMSEVVPMIPDPRLFFSEISRILKPSGRIILVNPLERMAIRQAYECNTLLIRFMRKLGCAPHGYDDYTARLQTSFGTSLKYLPTEDYYHTVLQEVGYRVEQTIFTPSAAAQELFERLQFVALCLGWPTYGAQYFLLYPVFKVIDSLARGRRGTGCVMVARRRHVEVVPNG